MSVLLDKASAAAVALITPAVQSLSTIPQVRAAKESDDKALPVVECDVSGGDDEETKDTGNFWVNWSINVKYSAAVDANGIDPAAGNQDLILAVGGVLSDTLASDLSSAVADFTVFPASIIFSAPSREQNENGVWIDSFRFRGLCCASAIS